MRSKLIYLDTNLWNRLADQRVRSKKLLRDLKHKDATLVISGQTLNELGRTFLSSAPNALSRARKLFRYLKSYVDDGIPYARDNMQVLDGEVDAMYTGASGVLAFDGPADYDDLRRELDKLSEGVFDKVAEDFIAGRKQFAQATRTAQTIHFQGKEHIRDELKSVPSDQLRSWMDGVMLSDEGAAMLASHLLRKYRDLPEETAFLTAQGLLHIPASRIAKGIVRADLYYNWRCANRASVPSDLADDIFHVLNASYCTVYATAEPKQAQYASLVLSTWTTVAIYDDKLPVDAWLISLV